MGKRRLSVGISKLCFKNGYDIVAVSEIDKDRAITIRDKNAYDMDLGYVYVREMVYEDENNKVKAIVEVLSATYENGEHEYIDVEDIREYYKINKCLHTEEEIRNVIIDAYVKISSSSII